MTKHILILGGSGLVGRALTNRLIVQGDIVVSTTYHTTPIHHSGESYQLDVSNIESVQKLLNETQPTHIISCLRGDFKAQLRCHEVVAQYLEKNEGYLYYCSTLNVFDGDMSIGHSETDKPVAESDYGQFKIACEELISDILGKRAIILRLPQVWGKTCRRLDELESAHKDSEKSIEVYPNLHLNVASDDMIAKQVIYIIGNELQGIFHLASLNTVLYTHYYRKICEVLRYNQINFVMNEEVAGQFILIPQRIREFPKALQETWEEVITYISDADFV